MVPSRSQSPIWWATAVPFHATRGDDSMRMIAWLLVAAMTTPAPAHAGGTPVWLRAYMAEYSAKHLEQVHAMIPAWARRYNKNCNDCHWPARSEEHTSELQSHSDLVCRLLLEKKKR